MPIALRSITPALVLMSGGRQNLGARSFIRTTGSRNSLILPELGLTVLLASWNCDYAEVMEVIVGFWLVTTRCATTTDKSCVGTFHVPISKTGSELRKDYNRKTSPSGKKSTKPRCLRRSLEPRPLCELCSRSSPRLRQPILRFSLPVRPEQARSLSPALSTDDQIAPRARSSV